MLQPPEWFKAFIYCEAFLQLPFFPVAAYAFLKGGRETTVTEGMSWGHFCKTPAAAAAAAENASISGLGGLMDVLWRAGLPWPTQVFSLEKQHRIKFVRNKTL